MRFLPLLLLFSSLTYADYRCEIRDMVEPGADGVSIYRPTLALSQINKQFVVKRTGDITGAYPTTGYQHIIHHPLEGFRVVSTGTQDEQPMLQVIEIYKDLDGLSFNRYIGGLGTLLVGRCTNPGSRTSMLAH